MSIVLAVTFMVILGGIATARNVLDRVGPDVLVIKRFQSKIHLGDSVVRLVRHGVIDPQKFEAIYQDRGGLPDEARGLLNAPSSKPILLTRKNADYYVNLLWPLGLANYMASNEQSPINKLSPVRRSSYRRRGPKDVGER